MRLTYRLAFIVLTLTNLPFVSSADPVVVVADGRIPGSQQPRVAVDERGSVYITFGANDDIYFSKSVDNGQEFSGPTKVGRIEKLSLGMRRGPRIVVSNESIVISAIGHSSGNLVAWRSDDGGDSWSGPVQVNDVEKSAREGLHAMACGPEGLLFCTWLDLRSGGTEIYGSRSVDGGKTWASNSRVYRSPSGTVCECCHPSVVIDRDQQIHVMWRNVLDGNRDMYLATSDDRGDSFRTARKLGLGSWPLNACPMDGGELAVSPEGDLITIWRRNNQVFTAMLDQPAEIAIGLGEQPTVSATADGDYFAWLARRHGDLMLATPAHQKPEKVATEASDPDMATSPTGTGPVVIVWEQGQKPNLSILSKTIVP